MVWVITRLCLGLMLVFGVGFCGFVCVVFCWVLGGCYFVGLLVFCGLCGLLGWWVFVYGCFSFVVLLVVVLGCWWFV